MKKITLLFDCSDVVIFLIFRTESYATRYSIDVKNFEFSPRISLQ